MSDVPIPTPGSIWSPIIGTQRVVDRIDSERDNRVIYRERYSWGTSGARGCTIETWERWVRDTAAKELPQ